MIPSILRSYTIPSIIYFFVLVTFSWILFNVYFYFFEQYGATIGMSTAPRRATAVTLLYPCVSLLDGAVLLLLWRLYRIVKRQVLRQLVYCSSVIFIITSFWPCQFLGWCLHYCSLGNPTLKCQHYNLLSMAFIKKERAPVAKHFEFSHKTKC